MCNLVLEDKAATLALTFGITSTTSVQVRNTEFLTMNSSNFFSEHLVLQALKSSLNLTGLSLRTSTVNSMQTVTSLKNTYISEKIFL